MLEYPKRLYRGGKGFTVNNLDEEQEFLGQSPIEIPITAAEVAEAKVESSEDKTEEALEYIISQGYSKSGAKRILKSEGLEAILKAKAEGRDPQE